MGLIKTLFGGWQRNAATNGKVAEYIEGVSVRDSDVLRRLREETGRMKYGAMQLGPNESQFLGLLVQLLDAKKTLEVGVFTGYSTLCTALALPDDGQIIACDISETWTSVGQRYWEEAGVAHKIDLRIGPAAETLAQLQSNGEVGSFDFAFVDADKGGYITYYEQCLDLLRPGGLIVFDNVLWGGAVANPKRQDSDTVALRALNSKLHADERVDVTLVPIGDGLMLARKR